MTLPVGSASWKVSEVTGSVFMTVTLYARCKTALSPSALHLPVCRDTWTNVFLKGFSDRLCFCMRARMNALWTHCVSWQTFGTLCFEAHRAPVYWQIRGSYWAGFARLWFRCSFKPIRNSACFLISCTVILVNTTRTIRHSHTLHNAHCGSTQHSRILDFCCVPMTLSQLS